MPTLDAIYTSLADQFLARFPQEISSPRTVGREAEFPVVTASGEAADVRRLWAALLQAGDLTPKYDSGSQNLVVKAGGADYSYEIEVGLGTIELNTRPCQTLFEVQAIMEVAVRRLLQPIREQGWRLLGYGIQPRTKPTLALMTPKMRYQSLYRAMGAEWLWYTVTASDQTQLAIHRAEVLQMLNYGNLIAPLIIAFCANSPLYADELGPYCSSREGQHLQIDTKEKRHGMPVRPYRDLVDFVARISQNTYLIRREESLVLPNSRSFSQYLQEHGSDFDLFDAFLFHEHYLWHSARVRATYGTIELRPACQQPWGEQMAVAALNVGLIEAANEVEAFIKDFLGVGYWEVMHTYHQRVIRFGLGAPQPLPDFLAQIVRLVETGLRQRGLGEEVFLAPIYERLYRMENPAQRARRIFLSDGVQAMIDQVTIKSIGD